MPEKIVKNPTRVLLWMLLFLLIVALVAGLLFRPLAHAFLANPVFNGMILGILLIGVAINIRQVLMLRPDTVWVEAARRGAEYVPEVPRASLLGSLSRLMKDRRADRLSLSTLTMRTLLDGIRSRLDEQRDLVRYFTGLLIFLGLLGTFWGLLDTLNAVGAVIRSLTVQGHDVAGVFDQLKTGLQQPLHGMGTAFSSSLFGLAGALVIGFCDLQAGHAQNRFYNDLEEWLSALTHFSSGAGGALEGEPAVPTYIQALLEQTADSLDKLQRTMGRAEDERRSADSQLVSLTEQIAELAEQTRSEQRMVMNLTKAQMEIQPALKQLAETATAAWSDDSDVRQHIRNLDGQLHRLVQELAAGRQETVDAMREELRLLTRTVSTTSNRQR